MTNDRFARIALEIPLWIDELVVDPSAVPADEDALVWAGVRELVLGVTERAQPASKRM